MHHPSENTLSKDNLPTLRSPLPFPWQETEIHIWCRMEKSCFVFLTVLFLLGSQGGHWYLSQLHRCEGKVQVFSYPLFLTDSKWDLSRDPLSHGPSMCCDDCTISVAIWRMCGDKYTLSFYAIPKQLTFSIITPWKQSLWSSSLQQPTKFNLGQWPPCKLLFNAFMNRQAREGGWI